MVPPILGNPHLGSRALKEGMPSGLRAVGCGVKASELGCGSSTEIGGGQYRPEYTIILIMGTPKLVPLILGNSNP